MPVASASARAGGRPRLMATLRAALASDPAVLLHFLNRFSLLRLFKFRPGRSDGRGDVPFLVHRPGRDVSAGIICMSIYAF
jgi:hypothetical protein